MTEGSIATSCRHERPDQLYKHHPADATGVVANVLKKAPTSIPGILSGLKNNLVLRFVPLEAFDNSLLVAMKAAVKRLPYSLRVRLLCTYSMVLYIIQQNTQQKGNKDRFMSAVGVSMAYSLCLRASEYVSKTKIPDPESHQFHSKSVEFKCLSLYG